MRTLLSEYDAAVERLHYLRQLSNDNRRNVETIFAQIREQRVKVQELRTKLEEALQINVTDPRGLDDL